jgi:hypothetical protein
MIFPMSKTLRIADALYLEAKAEAARTGISLTRFIEDSLRQRLETAQTGESRPMEIDPGNGEDFDSAGRSAEVFDLRAWI